MWMHTLGTPQDEVSCVRLILGLSSDVALTMDNNPVFFRVFGLFFGEGGESLEKCPRPIITLIIYLWSRESLRQIKTDQAL